MKPKLTKEEKTVSHVITLTVDQIKELAKFAGFSIGENITDMEGDTEISIAKAPDHGVKDDDEIIHCHHIAYLSEYPEEGVAPLGIIRQPRKRV